MFGTNVCNDEYSSISISEWSSQYVKERNLLELKDTIKVGDKKWTAVSSNEKKCDCIKEDYFDGNTEVFPVGTSDYEWLG